MTIADVRYPDVTCEAGRRVLDAPRVVGVCTGCGTTALPPRRKVWCSEKCIRAVLREYRNNHEWNAARWSAVRRDKYKCKRCGRNDDPPEEFLAIVNALPGSTREERAKKAKAREQLYRAYQLEVNHIDPRLGRGYGIGCHNHLENLETLCRPCHNKVTAEQRARRREAVPA